jgi:phosphate:Na+ symporter
MILMTKSIVLSWKENLEKPLKIIRKHPSFGILLGLIVTMFTQSSSATSVLVVSFVNGNILGLYEATAIIMGANIGTTFTSQLVSFNIYAHIPHVLFFSVLIYYLKLGPLFEKTCKFFIGLCLLFMGMHLMSYSLLPLKNLMAFSDLIKSVAKNPMKGIFMGALTTAIIQSSSTSIALLQSLSTTSFINIVQAVPIIIGQNIGTCVTTLFSSIVTNIDGRRTAFIHILLNILGTLAIYPFITTLATISVKLSPHNVVRQIAHAHTLFNIFFVILFFPFIKSIVSLSKKIIK